MRMYTVLLIVAALSLAVESAPIDNQKFAEAAAKSIHKAAEGFRTGMEKAENAEIAEMKDIKGLLSKAKVIGKHGEGKATLKSIGNGIAADASKAVEGEQTQQKLAVDTKNQVNSIINSLNKALGRANWKDGAKTGPPSSELGEGSDDVLKKALNAARANLMEVSATLKRETATSHTQEKIQRMVNEGKDLATPKKQLGEGSPGAASLLMKAEKEQKKVESKKAVTTKSEEKKASNEVPKVAQATADGHGAASMLQNAAKKAGKVSDDNDEMATIRKAEKADMMKLKVQEEAIEFAEKRNIGEVERLAGKLN